MEPQATRDVAAILGRVVESDPLVDWFGVPALELFCRRRFTVSHGELERFPAFMRSGPLGSVDALCRHYSGPLEVAAGSATTGVQTSVSEVHAAMLLRLGLTVYFSDLKRAIPQSLAWLKALEAALGLGQCATLGAFANAAGSGLAVHHDRFDQLFFQIRGHKRFRYLENRFARHPDVQFSPAAAVPAEWGQSYRHGFPQTTDELLQHGFETVELAPGSAFFMPSGTWHTTAEQGSDCLSLVVTVRAPTRRALLLNLLDYYVGQSEEWRRPAYRGFNRDGSAESERHELGALLADLGARLPGLPATCAYDAWVSHTYTQGTTSEYPVDLRFDRYIRLPNSSVQIDADGERRLRCTISSGPTSRPQARTVLGLNLEAEPILRWILAEGRAFSVDRACERFPDFERAELQALLAQLAYAALIRPLPAPEWDDFRPYSPRQGDPT